MKTRLPLILTMLVIVDGAVIASTPNTSSTLYTAGATVTPNLFGKFDANYNVVKSTALADASIGVIESNAVNRQLVSVAGPGLLTQLWCTGTGIVPGAYLVPNSSGQGIVNPTPTDPNLAIRSVGKVQSLGTVSLDPNFMDPNISPVLETVRVLDNK